MVVNIVGVILIVLDGSIFDCWERLDILIVVDGGMWDMLLLIEVSIFVVGLLVCVELGWCGGKVGIDGFWIVWFCDREVDGIMEMILLLIEVGGWVVVKGWIVGDVFFFVKLDIKFGFGLRILFVLSFVFGWCMDVVIVIVVIWELDVSGEDGYEEFVVIVVCVCDWFLLLWVWLVSFIGFIVEGIVGLRKEVFFGVILVSVLVVVFVGIWENVGCGNFIIEVSRGWFVVNFGMLFVIRFGVRWLGSILVSELEVGVIGRFWRGFLI